MKTILLAAVALVLAGCVGSTQGRVSTPLGDVDVAQTDSVPLTKTVEFKDCLARYTWKLGEDEHVTRAWCDCYIGASDQWRGQQWESYCGANDVPVEKPPAQSAEISVATPQLPDCDAGYLLHPETLACVAPPEPDIIVQQAGKDPYADHTRYWACMENVLDSNDGSYAVKRGKTVSAYRTSLGCILTILMADE